eukprot:CAMPEP_0194172120 /NCGR_PEP_ID=MMETSP0154-20130528/6610_1 /TAXON_ID=1049557 /ORGANISM="Thalassiothrix antarctica, Strain L6-D1" /LENGTH=371 /DNA_ID=CAMNT_0038884659 /DNA_START=4 /DNA_END=1119 /DNA_ORIENTATION=+
MTFLLSIMKRIEFIIMIVLPLIVTVDAAVTSTVTSRNSAAFTSHHFRRIRITPPKTSSLLEQYRGGGSSSAAMDGLKNSLASALAAACSKTLLAPLDTIKTVQQYHRSTLTGGYSKSLSFLQAINLIVSRPKGFREFYAGLGVTVVGSMPSVGLYFGVYSYCKRKLRPWFETYFGDENEEQVSSSKLAFTLTILASAAIGNTVASFSRVPFEVVKQKVQTGLYTSTWKALTDMIQKEGNIRAFFPLGGISIQMLRDIPYAMTTLLSYEILRSQIKQGKDETISMNDAFMGALAGGIGSFVTNPMDVIKTRLQTADIDIYNGSILKCFQMTWQEGGPMAFLRGSVPRLLHKIPANGAFFLFYEFFQTQLQLE